VDTVLWIWIRKDSKRWGLDPDLSQMSDLDLKRKKNHILKKDVFDQKKARISFNFKLVFLNRLKRYSKPLIVKKEKYLYLQSY
jgi:hypothetical protein